MNLGVLSSEILKLKLKILKLKISIKVKVKESLTVKVKDIKDIKVGVLTIIVNDRDSLDSQSYQVVREFLLAQTHGCVHSMPQASSVSSLWTTLHVQ